MAVHDMVNRAVYPDAEAFAATGYSLTGKSVRNIDSPRAALEIHSPKE